MHIVIEYMSIGKRRYNIKLWKVFTDCFNCLPIAAIIDEKIFCMHGGLSPDLKTMEQIRRVVRPTDVPDTGICFTFILFLSKTQMFSSFFLWLIVYFTGLLCDLLWSDPDKDIQGWGENDRGVSFTFGHDIVDQFLKRHDLDLICRAHQVPPPPPPPHGRANTILFIIRLRYIHRVNAIARTNTETYQ